MRGDLPVGLQIANTIHAAGESTPARVPPATSAVGLAARDEVQLLEIGARLAQAGIAHVPIIEEDGEHAGHLMAIGCEPTIDRESMRRVLSALPLAK